MRAFGASSQFLLSVPTHTTPSGSRETVWEAKHNASERSPKVFLSSKDLLLTHYIPIPSMPQQGVYPTTIKTQSCGGED